MTRIRLMDIVEDYISPSRLDWQSRSSGDWTLQIGQSYTNNIHKAGTRVVNDALNEFYIENNDYEGLRTSIDKYKL